VIHGNDGLEQIVLRGIRIRTSRDQEQRYDVVSWGELRRLEHREEAEKFHRDPAAQGMKVRLGMEASGHARWVPTSHDKANLAKTVFRQQPIATEKPTSRYKSLPTVSVFVFMHSSIWLNHIEWTHH
jgi:hypothetical protein